MAIKQSVSVMLQSLPSQSLVETHGLGGRVIHISHYVTGIWAFMHSLPFHPYVWQVTLFKLEQYMI